MKPVEREMERAVENARQFSRGWQADEGDGILSEEELTAHTLAGCRVCAQWEYYLNLAKRPGAHEIVGDETSG